MRKRTVHGRTHRVYPLWIAASTVLATIAAGGAAPAAAQTALFPTESSARGSLVPARPLTTSGRTWSAGSWVSGNGNTLGDVANVIGATSPAASKLDGKGSASP